MSDFCPHSPPRSAYLHIPFCFRRCFYCDFVVVPLGDKANGAIGPGSESIKAYLKLLHREISVSEKGPPLSTVYIGGGTPSLLSSTQISDLIEHLRRHFGFQDGSELTLEVDPGSFNEQGLDLYIDCGINRFSLGAQSFDDYFLEQIGRKHRFKNLAESCFLLDQAYKKKNISSWSLDLIQNLPGQSFSSWEKQLSQAIETSAPHLSIYDLSIEPGTVFAWREKRGELDLPKEDLAMEISRATVSMLKRAGFGRYEISNFAFPGHASRHNRVYWSGAGWWGFGQGATSSPWGQRLARPKTRDLYRSWVEFQEIHGPDPSLQASNAKKIAFDEQLIVGLRSREGVDLEALAKANGCNSAQRVAYLQPLKSRWQAFVEEGLLIRSGKRFRLSDPQGFEITNQVLVEMLLWWDSLPNDAVLLPNSRVPL